MNLVSGVQRVVVVMKHVTKAGAAKILRECVLPLTGKRVVHRIVTDLCVLDVKPDGLKLIELAPEVGFDEVAAKTDAAILAH